MLVVFNAPSSFLIRVSTMCDDHIDAGESPEMSPTSEFCDQDRDIADIRPVIEEIHQLEQRQILYYVRF